MNITREIITDLMPAYLSGEASADTRALVEEFLKQDPEYARLVKDEWNQNLLKAIPVSLPPDHEKITLNRTKALLRRRSLFLAFAMMFTLFPLSFAFSANKGITWIMLKAFPAGAVGSWAVALGCWIGFLATNHRLRTTGL